MNVRNFNSALQGGYQQEGTLRNQLRAEWAGVDKWIRLQPIDDVKEYLGVKFAFYFAWLGFYTQLLIPAAILGIAVFIYGITFLSADDYRYFISVISTLVLTYL